MPLYTVYAQAPAQPATRVTVQSSAAAPEYDAEQKAALTELNRLRAAAGLPLAALDPSLTRAAQAHSRYYVAHAGDRSMAGLGAHTEEPGTSGFTGATPAGRATHFGFSGQEVAEAMHFVPTAEQAVSGWRDSVYHRIPLLDPSLTKVGYGYAQAGSTWVNTMDLGTGDTTPGVTGPVVYPYPGQQDVPVDFDGNEIPDPLRSFSDVGKPVGYPITVQFGHLPVTGLAAVQAAVYDQDGSPVDAVVLTPDSDAYLWSAIAVIPVHPLAPDHEYTVSVQATLQEGGQAVAWSRQWHFHTERYPAPRVRSLRWVTTGGSIRNVTVLGSNLGNWDRLYLGGAPARLIGATPTSATYQVSPEAIGPVYDLVIVTPEWKEFSWPEAISVDGARSPLPSPITVVVDGRIIDARVYQIAGRTLVPLRAVAEGLQAEVEWIGPSRRVYFHRGSRQVTVIVDSLIAQVQDERALLDVPPVLIGDRTYVPVRFVAESLGAGVQWNAARRTVVITTR